MKKLVKILFLCMPIATMCGCYKVDSVDNLPKTRIRLLMSQMKTVETRSLASQNERTISDAYLLVFASDGSFRCGERVDVGTAIADNGYQNPTLTTELSIADGDQIVVLCNTGCTFTEIPSTVSTVDDINTAFTSAKWTFDWSNTAIFGTRKIPMSGTMTYDSTDTTAECELVRAYAKVDLTLASPATMKGEYASTMTDAKTTWRPYNITLKGVATIYNPTTTPLITSTESFYPSAYNDIPTTGYSTTDTQDMMYFYEYPNSTKASTAGAAALVATEWSKDRTCMIVKNDLGKFYRIDFYDHDNGVYLDFLRNHHYLVKITRVSSEGYNTPEEALANPSSNIEYEIYVSEEFNQAVSNGQYAIALDNERVKIFDDNADILKFSLLTNTDAPINLSTAIVDIVDAAKTTVVSCPDDIRLNGVAPIADGAGNKVFTLGTLTAANDYALSCTSVFRDNQSAIAALNGCFLRIRMGNITQYVPIDVLDVSFYYGTANCVEQLPVAGTYSFDCTPYTTASSTYAYQNTTDLELVYPRSAKMLWSDVASNHITGATVTQIGDKFTLTYTTTGAAGNAVIGIYDTVNPDDTARRLLWSFHIWISDRTATADTDQNWSTINFDAAPALRTITPNRYWMMDRNLGATSTVAPTATTLDNVSSFGLLYQWGRKDPFIGGSDYNGSAFKTMYTPLGTMTKTTVSATDSSKGTVNYSIGNPTDFISETTGQDWIYGNTYKTDKHKLWGCKTAMYVSPVTVQDDKAIYDPCPTGYKVAPSDAFSMLLRPAVAGVSGSGNGVGVHRDLRNTGWNVYDPNDNGDTGLNATYPTDNYGLYIYYADEMNGPVSYFPFTGNINRANGNYSKQAPLIHTNSDLSPNSNYVARCSFNTTSFYSVWYSGRAGGQSVRCVRVQ